MATFTIILLLISSFGGVIQEGPVSEAEWEMLFEELMIRMAEENEWGDFSEENLPTLSPDSEEDTFLGKESMSGEDFLRLLLDENTDIETRLLMLETLRQSEDPTVLEEILQAFAKQAEKEAPPAKKIKEESPQVKIKTVSRKQLVSEKTDSFKEENMESPTSWVNILVGGLALSMAAAFLFLRRGQIR